MSTIQIQTHMPNNQKLAMPIITVNNIGMPISPMIKQSTAASTLGCRKLPLLATGFKIGSAINADNTAAGTQFNMRRAEGGKVNLGINTGAMRAPQVTTTMPMIIKISEITNHPPNLEF